MGSFRFDPKPQSGKSKGLVLVLDAHTDLVTGSSISNDFEACEIHRAKGLLMKLSYIEVLLSSLQGFEAVVDSRKEYPLTKRDSVLIRPGHIVSGVYYPWWGCYLNLNHEQGILCDSMIYFYLHPFFAECGQS